MGGCDDRDRRGLTNPFFFRKSAGADKYHYPGEQLLLFNASSRYNWPVCPWRRYVAGSDENVRSTRDDQPHRTSPGVPTSTDPITVTMTTNQPKSVEERVYLRWSNDWFITSHIIEASPGGDGLTYTAAIPPQPDGNSCFYTVLTSTADLTGYTGSGIIDELTLAVNGTFDALPTPPAASPTPTPTATATPTVTPTATPTVTATPTATVSPTPTPAPRPARRRP